jgi:hypothetical protein
LFTIPAYLTTTISTAAALLSSFIASQYILCFMYRNEKNKQAGHPDAFRPNIRNGEVLNVMRFQSFSNLTHAFLDQSFIDTFWDLNIFMYYTWVVIIWWILAYWRTSIGQIPYANVNYFDSSLFKREVIN